MNKEYKTLPHQFHRLLNSTYGFNRQYRKENKRQYFYQSAYSRGVKIYSRPEQKRLHALERSYSELPF